MKKINIILLARQLRQCYTEEEDILWQALRNRKLGGLKFRRQHPFGIYILDFYCAEKKFEIELDGAQHFTTEGRFNDKERERFLLSFEIRTIRFANHRIRNDLENVLEEIYLMQTPHPDPFSTIGWRGVRGEDKKKYFQRKIFIESLYNDLLSSNYKIIEELYKVLEEILYL